MKILYLASEVAPWSKTGGLADVSGALPAALARLGHEVRVVTPLYASVDRRGLTPLEARFSLRFPFGEEAASLFEAREGSLRVLFVHHPGFFDRPGLYGSGQEDYPDNHRRFAFFGMAALAAAQATGFAPDVVHLNDWQTGLCALALKRGYRGTALGRAKSVFTVHNLAYQGLFPQAAVEELGLPGSLFVPEGLEFYDHLSFLKAGLTWADALTTVSPTYAKEIQTPDGGWGLDGLLRRRALDLEGILNGVDTKEWNPATDPLLPAGFTARDLTGKRACRTELLRRFGLPETPASAPVFGMVSRMVAQKGFDILLPALPRILEEADLRMVFLGTGDPRYQLALEELAQRYPKKLAVRVGYDVGLSHLLEAGSDFFLMPSQYEPCGLNQMYSLLYGAVPIVRAVGGLADTVVDLDAPGANGITFTSWGSQAVVEAVRRALALYRDPERLQAVREAGMGQALGWDRSARGYQDLYARLAGRNELPNAAKAL